MAAVGLSHPMDLTASTVQHWTTMHQWLVPVFPLLGLALFQVLRGAPRWAKLLAGVFVFGYAIFYTALDVLSGIGTGVVVMQRPTGSDGLVRALFGIGNRLGWIGSIAFLAAAIVAAGSQLLRFGRPVVIPALVLVLGAVSFLNSHIYPWRGVLTVALIGLATGWLALISYRHTPVRSRVRPLDRG